MLDRFQLADLLGRSDPLDPPRQQHLLRPSQIRAWAAGDGPREAERLVVELDVEGQQRLGRAWRLPDGGRDLRQVRHATAVRPRQPRIEHPQHDDVEVVRLAHGRHDRGHVRPPGDPDRDLGEASDRRPVGRDEQQRRAARRRIGVGVRIAAHHRALAGHDEPGLRLPPTLPGTAPRPFRLRLRHRHRRRRRLLLWLPFRRRRIRTTRSRHDFRVARQARRSDMRATYARARIWPLKDRRTRSPGRFAAT